VVTTPIMCDAVQTVFNVSFILIDE
jgi:hypothetical protein